MFISFREIDTSRRSSFCEIARCTSKHCTFCNWYFFNDLINDRFITRDVTLSFISLV